MTNGPRRRPEDCIGEMLRAIYDEVHQHHPINLGTKPEDYVGEPFHDSLTSIYSALEEHRGFRDFVKVQHVVADFYIPNPGFVVECDESQHFTLPRKVSLENYPDEKKVGYLKEQWIVRCAERDKHDNDPPFRNEPWKKCRDEQRAWYDTIRDFLPEIKGFQPTVRLYSEERDWCRLDPKNEEDIETFKKIISEKQKQFTIEVISDINPKFARVIVKGPWEGNIPHAKTLIEDIIRMWPSQDRVAFFVTPGAFLRFPWPEQFPAIEDNLYPPEESLVLLRNAAQKYCDQFLDEKLRTALVRHTDYLTIGIDSEDKRKKNGYQVEFVALVDLKTNQYFWTGKSYPDSPQEHRLIRISDLSSHFVQIPMGKVMVLGCHDLKLFSERGREKTKTAWRKSARQDIYRLVAQEKPIIILQHPHTTNSFRSWLAEWYKLASCCYPDVMYISAGLYTKSKDMHDTSFTKTREYTRRGTSIDFIVHENSVQLDNAKNLDTSQNPSVIKIEKKSTEKIPISKDCWNANRFLEGLREKAVSKNTIEITKNLIDWARVQSLDLGETYAHKEFTPFLGTRPNTQQLFSVTQHGKMKIEFQFIHKYPQFSDEEKRHEFIERLNKIRGFDFSMQAWEEKKKQPVDMELLGDPQNLDSFISMATWFFDELRKENKQ